MGGGWGLFGRRGHPFLAMAEVVRGRQGAEDIGVVGAAAGERAEGLELANDHVPVAAEALELALRQQQRLCTHERTEALVDDWGHDQVDLAELVLEEHEDDSVRRCRPLSRDRHPRDCNLTTRRSE